MIITPQPPPGEEARVAAIRAEISSLFGHMPAGMELLVMTPEILEQRWATMQYYLRHPRLSMALLAFIRLLVSDRLGAPFCIGMNQAILQKKGVAPDAIEAARQDPSQAPLPEAERVLLLLVLKATEAPLSVTADDLATARTHGWSDRDILEAILHGANNVAADILFNTYKVGVTSC